MHFAQKDEEYFRLMNEELEKEVGVNVLGTLIWFRLRIIRCQILEDTRMTGVISFIL